MSYRIMVLYKVSNALPGQKMYRLQGLNHGGREDRGEFEDGVTAAPTSIVSRN